MTAMIQFHDSRLWSLPRALATVMLLASVGCAGLTRPWQAPGVMMTSLKPTQITLQEQSFLVGLRIRNPNDRMLPIKAITYTLSLEGTEIAAGGARLERQIPAFGEEAVEVSVTGNAGALVGMLPTLMLESQPLQYRLTGTVTLAGVLPIPYRYSGEIDPKALLPTAGWPRRPT